MIVAEVGLMGSEDGRRGHKPTGGHQRLKKTRKQVLFSEPPEGTNAAEIFLVHRNGFWISDLPMLKEDVCVVLRN